MDLSAQLTEDRIRARKLQEVDLFSALSSSSCLSRVTPPSSTSSSSSSATPRISTLTPLSAVTCLDRKEYKTPWLLGGPAKKYSKRTNSARDSPKVKLNHHQQLSQSQNLQLQQKHQQLSQNLRLQQKHQQQYSRKHTAGSCIARSQLLDSKLDQNNKPLSPQPTQLSNREYQHHANVASEFQAMNMSVKMPQPLAPPAPRHPQSATTGNVSALTQPRKLIVSPHPERQPRQLMTNTVNTGSRSSSNKQQPLAEQAQNPQSVTDGKRAVHTKNPRHQPTQKQQPQRSFPHGIGPLKVTNTSITVPKPVHSTKIQMAQPVKQHSNPCPILYQTKVYTLSNDFPINPELMANPPHVTNPQQIQGQVALAQNRHHGAGSMKVLGTNTKLSAAGSSGSSQSKQLKQPTKFLPIQQQTISLNNEFPVNPELIDNPAYGTNLRHSKFPSKRPEVVYNPSHAQGTSSVKITPAEKGHDRSSSSNQAGYPQQTNVESLNNDFPINPEVFYSLSQPAISPEVFYCPPQPAANVQLHSLTKLSSVEDESTVNDELLALILQCDEMDKGSKKPRASSSATETGRTTDTKVQSSGSGSAKLGRTKIQSRRTSPETPSQPCQKQRPVAGASRQQIDNLPTHYVKAKSRMKLQEPGTSKSHQLQCGIKESCDICAVCLMEYKGEDIIRTLPCLHGFHSKCIDQWLLKKAVCPICKYSIKGNM